MNKRMDITIAEKVYQIGFSFRAIRLFEEMTGKSIQEVSGSWDNLLYAYCSLQALNEEFTMTVEEFVDILDEDPGLLIELQFGNQEKEEKEDKDIKEVKDIKGKKKIQLFLGLWMLSVLLLVAPVLIPVTFGLTWIFGNLKALFLFIVKGGKRRA